MGLFRAILDSIKRLFGIGSAPVLALQTPSDNTPDPTGYDDEATFDEDDDEDYEVDEPVDRDTSHEQANEAVEDAWGDLRAVIAKFEAEAIELAGVTLDDPLSFWTRERAIANAERDGSSTDEAARASGFDDAEHWFRVRAYVEAKWSRRVERDEVVEIVFAEGFERARDRARGSAA